MWRRNGDAFCASGSGMAAAGGAPTVAAAEGGDAMDLEEGGISKAIVKKMSKASKA